MSWTPSRRQWLRTLLRSGALTLAAPACTSGAGPRDGGDAGLDLGGLDLDGLNDTTAPTTARTAIVVGSGYGGSVAALRLAEAGVQVTVLERGLAWPVTAEANTFCTTFAPDERSTWLRERTVAPLGPQFPIDRSLGVLAREDFDGMQVYTGAGVGGGSLVYGCMTVQPPRAQFESVFGGMFDYDEFESSWYPLVRDMLRASPVPADIFAQDFYAMSRQFEAIGRAVGIESVHIDLATDWDVVRREMAGEAPAAAIVGDLLYGANSGYKHSLDRTYLADAVATGRTEIVTQANVVGLARGASGGWVAEVEHIDTRGERQSSSELEADLVVLGAGSLGTTELLLKAKRRGVLPGLPDTLGGQWGTNGNVMFMRSELNVDTGPQQANPPVLAANFLDNAHTPIIVENAPFPFGIECNCLLQLAVSAEPPSGRMELNDAGEALQLDWPEDGNTATVAAVLEFSERMHGADGGRVGGLFLPEPTQHFTYHPLGGAVAWAVCDAVGRVAGEPGLYVVDSALIPGTVGCANPSLTIAAIAERALSVIVREDLGRVG